MRRRPSWRWPCSSSSASGWPSTSGRAGSNSSLSFPKPPPAKSSGSSSDDRCQGRCQARCQAPARVLASRGAYGCRSCQHPGPRCRLRLQPMRDIRYAVRILLKSPIFGLTAILTLALCIGANTAIYSVVDRVLLRPLPYPHPERLAMVMTHFEPQHNDEGGQTGGIWEVVRDHVTSADVACVGGMGMGVNLVAQNQPQY